MPVCLIGNERESDHRLDTNPIYLAHQGAFSRVLGDFDGSKEMLYECYVARPSAIDTKLFPVLADDVLSSDPLLGEYEGDLLVFALNSIASNTLLLVGSVGCGKSALLMNVQRIVRDSPALNSRLHFIRLNFNALKSRIEDIHQPKSLDAVKAATLAEIAKRINSECAKIAGEYKDSFLDYAWKHSDYFKQYAPALDLYERTDHVGIPDYRKVLEQDFLHSSDYTEALLQFIHQVHGQTVVVAIDNVDPLNRHVHETLIWFAEQFAGNPAAKIIIAMRDNTAEALRLQADALAPTILRLQAAEVLKVLQRRTSFLMKQLQISMAEPPYRQQMKRMGLGNIDAKRVIDQMFEATLNEQVVSTIRNLSNGNLRLAIKLLPTYLQSGYLHTGPLAKFLSQPQSRRYEPEIPTHVFVQSVVTGNAKTYFGSSGFATIHNVWCDGVGVYPVSHFFKLMLLGAVAQMPRSTYESLQRTIDYVFREHGIKEYMTSRLERTLVDMINSWLVRTPEFLLAERGDVLQPGSRLDITRCGQFYRSEFAYSLEYFGYVKDAILLEHNNMKAVSSIAASLFSERFAESLRVIEYLVEQESKLYDQLMQNRETWIRFCQSHLIDRDEETSRIQMRCTRFVSAFRNLKFEHPEFVTALGAKRLERVEGLLIEGNAKIRDADE